MRPLLSAPACHRTARSECRIMPGLSGRPPDLYLRARVPARAFRLMTFYLRSRTRPAREVTVPHGEHARTERVAERAHVAAGALIVQSGDGHTLETRARPSELDQHLGLDLVPAPGQRDAPEQIGSNQAEP